MLLLTRIGRTHSREPAGGADLVDLARPAVVKHPFIAPLVAEFLDQRGNKAGNGIAGMDRWHRMELFHPLDDRRGVLNAGALRRNHQWNDRHPGVFFKFRLARRTAKPIDAGWLYSENRSAP